MPPDPETDAASIARRQFSSARRGLDPDEVRSYLRELADLVDGLQRRAKELQERAEAAEARVEKVESLDEHRLVELLGEETARILDAGRVASADIRRKAEESAERLIAEANEEAHRLRAETEAELLKRRAAVGVELDALRAEAAAELDRRRAEGAELVAEIRRTAQAEADELVDEAQVVRTRMLGDLARRRRAAREQLERLNAARERLLAAYDVVRRTVDEATSELTVALPEAKVAGDTAMRRVNEEPEPTVEALEDLVAMARIAGLLDPSSLPAEAEADPEVARVPDPEPERRPDPGAARAPEPERQPDAEVPGSGPSALPEREVEVALAPEPERQPADTRLTEPQAEVSRGPSPEPEVARAPEAGEEEDEWSWEVEDEEWLDDEGDEPEPVLGLQPEGEEPRVANHVDALFARLKAETHLDAEEEPGGVAVLHQDEYDYDVPHIAEVEADEPEPDDEEDQEVEDEAAFASAPVAGDDELVRQRDSLLATVEQELNRRLKRVLADEQNEVLDLLRRTTPSSSDDLLPTLGAHTARYTEAARDELGAAASWGAAAVGGEPDGAADALAVELGQTVVEPLRERIARSFTDTGGDLEEVTGRLRALYREWKSQRIGTAVRHYAVSAYAQGAYGAMPDGTPLRWLVDRTSDPCPDADDNALAGAVCKGEAFPTGDHCPPAHLGCRCMVVPAE